jgi:vacuolar protein sorting-associated protein 35
MADLYESVQHAGNIIPRLYLLITVGSAYIKTKEAPVKFILHDLFDMVKGVQQPIRGLFLRYYLLKMMKDKLPDSGSEYEGAESGDVNDAVEFIL